VLGVYVREKKVLTLEEAVRKMSSFRRRAGPGGSRVLRPGMKADIAVFDAAAVRDTGRYEKPHQYAEGFSQRHRKRTGRLREWRDDGRPPGRVLYGPGKGRMP